MVLAEEDVVWQEYLGKVLPFQMGALGHFDIVCIFKSRYTYIVIHPRGVSNLFEFGKETLEDPPPKQ